MNTIRTILTGMAILTLLLFAACSNGMLSSLQRPSGDPVPVIPNVDSFGQLLTDRISWEADPAADEYVLYAAVDEGAVAYNVLYRGTGTSVIHSNLEPEKRYLYRLSKFRGSREFGPSDAVMGVGNSSSKDEWENNDTRERATLLEADIFANTYFYRSTAEDVLQDVDWYKITIPPRRRAEIVFPNYGEHQFSGTLFFYLEGDAAQLVDLDREIAIDNPYFETRTFYFRVYPNPTVVIGGGSIEGGKFISYHIKLYRIIEF
jgi:hypothetical protein